MKEMQTWPWDGSGCPVCGGGDLDIEYRSFDGPEGGTVWQRANCYRRMNSYGSGRDGGRDRDWVEVECGGSWSEVYELMYALVTNDDGTTEVRPNMGNGIMAGIVRTLRAGQTGDSAAMYSAISQLSAVLGADVVAALEPDVIGEVDPGDDGRGPCLCGESTAASCLRDGCELSGGEPAPASPAGERTIRVAVIVEGGMVQSVFAEGARGDVAIVDWDTEGADGDRLTMCGDGNAAYVQLESLWPWEQLTGAVAAMLDREMLSWVPGLNEGVPE